VTGGTYCRHFTIDGRRCNHVPDPRTGRPTDGRTVSATVVHRTSGAAADVLATACMVLPTGEATRLLEGLPGAEGPILENSPDGLLHHATAGFKEYSPAESVVGAVFEAGPVWA
jgi:thiamine biosynthesis lipoprotein